MYIKERHNMGDLFNFEEIEEIPDEKEIELKQQKMLLFLLGLMIGET